jgi:hypothetical protein
MNDQANTSTDQDQPMTEDEKTRLYRDGRYLFSTPPVCHAQWDESAWIRYIDAHGAWVQDAKWVSTTYTN